MSRLEPSHLTSACSEDHRWEKLLWRRQPFPDNYVPDSFLSALRRNSNFRPYTYSALVLTTLPVTQHVASIFLFLSIFLRLRLGVLDPSILLWASILIYLFGYMLWEVLEYSDGVQQPDRNRTRVKAFKSSMLVFLALVATSPVLKTLTEATASDSIWALSASLFSLNAILADYTKSNRQASQERLTSVLSMNAAISASVVLASRLQSDLSVLALILFSVILFALSPMLRRRIQTTCSPFTRALLTLILGISSIAAFISLSTTVTYIVALVLCFITFACPAFLVWAQRFKNEIKGPWDPAIPKVR